MAGATSTSQSVHTSCGPSFGDALDLRSVNAIWQLFVVLLLSVNASRIGEQFFAFLERIGPLAFYIPQLSITDLARLICRSSAYRLWFQSVVSTTCLKLRRNLTEIFYRRFLAISHGVILAKCDVFIDFYIFSKKSNAFLNITMDVQRLN